MVTTADNGCNVTISEITLNKNDVFGLYNATGAGNAYVKLLAIRNNVK